MTSIKGAAAFVLAAIVVLVTTPVEAATFAIRVTGTATGVLPDILDEQNAVASDMPFEFTGLFKTTIGVERYCYNNVCAVEIYPGYETRGLFGAFNIGQNSTTFGDVYSLAYLSRELNNTNVFGIFMDTAYPGPYSDPNSERFYISFRSRSAASVVDIVDWSPLVGNPDRCVQAVCSGSFGTYQTPFLLTLNVTAFEVAVLDSHALAVPEPRAWALMLLGFGLVGGAVRRCRPDRLARRRRRPVAA